MDGNNKIRHAEYVKEVADFPNYEAALAAARGAVTCVSGGKAPRTGSAAASFEVRTEFHGIIAGAQRGTRTYARGGKPTGARRPDDCRRSAHRQRAGCRPGVADRVPARDA